MFGSSKPVPFDPYGSRRSGRRFPRWLLLLLSGMAAGAGGVVFVQERYLPPRLSAGASTALRSAFDEADSGRQRLQTELADTTKKLEAAQADTQRLTSELAASRSTTERQREDIAAAISALPPDPRGGTVEVRAARFTAKGGALAYEVVLTRERASGKPMPGVLQLAVTGDSARGGESTVNLKPVTLALGGQNIERGSLALPEGFRPRQTTLQVLDRVGGRSLGLRVLPVK